MVQLEEGADSASVMGELVDECPGSTVISTSELVRGVSMQLGAIGKVFLVFLTLVVIVAALALAGRISALTTSRMRELGLMRAMGAGKGKVVGYLACETGITTVIGAMAGVAVSWFGAAQCVGLLHSTFSIPGASPNPVVFAAASFGGMAFAVFLNALCLIQPTLRLRRFDPQETLARGDM